MTVVPPLVAVSFSELIPLAGIGIAILTVTGWFTVAIVRLVSRQRLRELAYRERIPALERGGPAGGAS